MIQELPVALESLLADLTDVVLAVVAIDMLPKDVSAT